jgi:hypothetical protein
MTLDSLLDALTQHTPDSRTVDEMAHSGEVGISFVERWPATMNGGWKGGTVTVWIWRVMWIPRRVRGGFHRQHKPIRIAYGVSDGGQEGAQAAGRREARRLAKLRREALEEAA